MRQNDGPGTRMGWDFFLAHAGADAPIATELHGLLARRYRVFLDKKSLRLGDDWDTAIARALYDTAIIVALVSSKYEPAYYFREEIATAIQMARTDPDTHRVVPVFLEGWPDAVQGIPYGLRLKQGLDAKQLGIVGVATELERLAADLVGEPLAPFPEAGATRYARERLFETLQGLRAEQLNDIVVKLGARYSEVMPSAAAQTMRILDLIQYVEQHEGLDWLADAIKETGTG